MLLGGSEKVQVRPRQSVSEVNAASYSTAALAAADAPLLNHRIPAPAQHVSGSCATALPILRGERRRTSTSALSLALLSTHCYTPRLAVASACAADSDGTCDAEFSDTKPTDRIRSTWNLSAASAAKRSGAATTDAAAAWTSRARGSAAGNCAQQECIVPQEG